MKKRVRLFFVGMILMLLVGCGKTAPEEIAADLVLGDYEHLSIETAENLVTDADVEEQLQKLVKNQTVYQTIADRPARDGDTVTIGFSGRLEDGSAAGESSGSYDLKLGSGTLIPGFEAGLIGAKAGDVRQLLLEFPEDYYDTEKAGKPVTFTVTVHEIRRELPAELTDEWAEAYSVGTADSVAELKVRMLEELQGQNEKERLEHVKEELLIKVTEASEVPVREEEIEEKFTGITGMYAEYAAAYNIAIETFYEAAGVDEKQLREKAEQSVRQQKVVEAIFKKEGMSITPQDEEKYAALWETGVEDLKAQLGEEEFAANVKADMVSDLLYEKAKN